MKDQNIELPPIPEWGAVHTERSGKVELYPQQYRLALNDVFIRGAKAAIEPYAKRIAELEAARIAYASEFAPDEDGEPDVGRIHENIRKLKADRKRRDEPIAWVKPDIVENQFINMHPRRVWWECNEGIGMAIYTGTQPTEPSRSEPGVSTTQVLITLGKVIAGYRPGEEGWSEYDQQAYDAAMSVPQPLSESDIPAELVSGLSAEQLAEILMVYIKPEIIRDALEKLENAPWELSEPVKHDLYKTGDKDAPEQIRDRNGVVVLDCCKRCGKFESQLSEPCVAEPAKVPSAEVERLIDIYGFRCEHYGREAAESARQILLASYGQCS